MTPRQYYKSNTREASEALALAAGTTFGNFQQIALANGAVSRKLARRLADESNGQLTEMEILYQEDIEAKHKDDAA